MASRRVTPEEHRCPKGKCERCFGVGKDNDRVAVAIPGPKSKSKHKYRVCARCGQDLVRQWRYILLRIVPGGVDGEP